MNKSFEIVEILDIPFCDITFDTFTNELEKYMIEQRKAFVVTANPEIVMYARNNSDYKQIILQADFIVPDGIGIIKASHTVGTPLKERVTGYDTTIRLLEKMNEEKLSLYVLGGKDETLKKAIANIANTYPSIQVVGSHHGYFDWKDTAIVEEIQVKKPDLILVALGFPRQEKWIYEHVNQFEKGVFIGVGGTIDVLAGEVERAPQFWQNIHLEWFYRLLKQPSRWKRMLAIPRFILEIKKQNRHCQK